MSRSTRKPWITDSLRRSKTNVKRKENRRYRKYVRQDLAQWRSRYYMGIIRGCNTCDCMEELWDDDDGIISWPSCLSFELEPAYDHPNRYRTWCNINGFRHYCDEPKHSRK